MIENCKYGIEIMSKMIIKLAFVLYIAYQINSKHLLIWKYNTMYKRIYHSKYKYTLSVTIEQLIQ